LFKAQFADNLSKKKKSPTRDISAEISTLSQRIQNDFIIMIIAKKEGISGKLGRYYHIWEAVSQIYEIS
jgi:hypothetical protein